MYNLLAIYSNEELFFFFKNVYNIKASSVHN